MRKIALFLLLLVPNVCFSQSPDSRGEIAVTQPTYKDATATAPILAKYHIRNEGGSDGAGLCVISSVLCNGGYQGVPGLEGGIGPNGEELGKNSRLWKLAKSRPGGYYPEKLANLIDEVLPDEKYANYTGTNVDILNKISELGYPIGATMNTGAMYGYKPIHHMISLIHYRTNGYACVVDNNDPGKYHWMPAKEFDRRWIDGGTGWAFIWTRLPVAAQISSVAPIIIVSVVCGVVLVILGLQIDGSEPCPEH